MKKIYQKSVACLVFMSGLWAQAQGRGPNPIEQCRSEWEAVGCSVPTRPDRGSQPPSQTEMESRKTAMENLKSCVAKNKASISDSSCQELSMPPMGREGGRPPGPPPGGGFGGPTGSAQ